MTNLSGDYTRVRVADASDEEELMQLCRLLHGENAIFSISDEKVRDVLRIAFEGRGGIVGVIGNPGGIQGSIYLQIGTDWYTNEYSISELWSYCLPQYRSSNNSRDLIAFAKWCSDRMGLPLMIGVLSNHRTEAKVRLYRRALGEPAGAFFLHGAHTGRGVN